jgi:hypothetical protein
MRGKSNSVKIGNVSIENVEGDLEEIADLKSLIDDVTVRCYQGERSELVADLAEVIKTSACSCPDKVICRQLIEVVEKWATTKLATQVAEEFLSAIDDFDDEFTDNISADEWEKNSSCDRSPTEELVQAHCSNTERLPH